MNTGGGSGGGTVTSSAGSVVKVANGATLEFGGTATLASGSTLKTDGKVLTTAGANLAVNGGLQSLTGALTSATASLTATGGVATYGASNAFTLSNVIINGGQANFTSTALTTEALTFSSGTLGGSGPGLVLDTNQSGTWSGGTLAGPLSVSSGATLALNGGAKVWGAGGALTNNGTVTWSAGNIDIQGAGTVTNNGLFDLTGGVVLGDLTGFNNGLAPVVTFANTSTGTLRSTSAVAPVVGSNANPGSQNFVNITNDGVIDVQGGGLRLNVNTGGGSGGGTVTSSSGSLIKVASGAIAEIGGSFTLGGGLDLANGATVQGHGAFVISNGGILRGLGTVDVGSGTLQNNGTIAPGTLAVSTGTLNVLGNYTQGAGGALAIDLAGTALGQFDVLAVSGTATLAGTLTAGLINGFQPTAGSQFAILQAASRNGDFTSKTLPINFTATPGANYVLNLSGSVCTGSICFDNTGGDFLWTNPLNWNTDILPTLSDAVVIDLVGNNTIVLNTGVHTIGSLVLSGNNTLNIAAGSLTLSNDSLLAGAVRISGGTLAIDATNVTATTLVQLAGTLAINAGKTLTVSGRYDWTGGGVNGPGTLAASAATVWNINDSVSNHLLSGLTVNNAGVVNYNVLPGNGLELQLNNGSIFNNQAGAVFDFKSDALVSHNLGSGGTFNNSGVVKKSGGTGDSGFANLAQYNNINGTVDSGTGTILLQINGTHSGTFTVLGDHVLFNAGIHNFADGSVLNGAFNFTGAAVNLGTTTVNDTLTVSAGTINLGGKTTTIDGVLNWLGGSTLVGGTLALTAANVTNINDSVAGGPHVLGGMTVNNAGVVNYNGVPGNGGDLLLNGGSVFNNQVGAVFDFKSDVLVNLNEGSGGTFNNSGVVKKSGGTGNSGFANLAQYNNINGTVDSGTGTILLQVNGAHSGTFTVLGDHVLFNATHSFADGSVLNGTINLSGGSLTFANATLNDTLNLTGGTLAISAAKTLTVDGLFNWSAGATVAGPGNLALSAANVWNINDSVGGGNHNLNGLNIANGGRVNYSLAVGNGRELLSSNGTVFTNLAAATFDIQGDIGVLDSAGCNPCRFDNSGLVVKSAGTGVGGMLGSGLTVSNAVGGVFRASSGRLEMSNFNVNDGTIDTAAGASFATTAGTLTNNGTLSGRGTFNISAVTNNGTIAPSLGSPLIFTGDLNLTPTSQLVFDVGGTHRGIDQDAINVQGTLTAGGTLRASLANGFVPSQNTFYNLITAASVGGSFANSVVPANFTTQLNPADVSLHFFNCAGSICFDNEAGDFLWSNPLNWTANVLPVASDDVAIDLGTTLTVILNQGVQAAGSLLTASGVQLDLSGGFLTVQGAATLNGGLGVHGGNLLTRGALTVAGNVDITGGAVDFGGLTNLRGNLTVSNGRLGGAGNVTVANTFNWSGGTLGDSGTLTVATGGRLSITGSQDKFLDGPRRLINNATNSLWSGSGAVLASDTEAGLATFVNNGSLTIQTAAAWRDGNIINNGTLTKNSVGGAQHFNDVSGSFDNAGVFKIDAGDVVLAGGGNHSGSFRSGSSDHLVFASGDDLTRRTRFLTGAQINGGVIDMLSGVIEFAGSGLGLHFGPNTDLNLAGAEVAGAGNFTVDTGSTVKLSAGSLGGSGTHTINDEFQWLGGSVNGGTLVTSNLGTTLLSSSTPLSLQNATWINSSRARLNDTTLILSGANARVVNRGSMRFNLGAGIVGDGRFDNESAATLTVASANVSHLGVTMNNTGAIVIESGVLQFDHDFTNQGNIDLGFNQQGGMRAGNIGVFVNGTQGRVFGSGLIDVADAGIAFTNAGVVAPGHSPGVITINGDFVQTASGRLSVEIGGTRPGLEFDLLNISGRATLAGAIELDLLNNFLPAAGGAFDVVNSASLVGDFQSVILPSGQVLKGAALAAVYQISAAALLAGSAPPQNAIDNVLVMPSVDIGRASGSIVVNDGVGEPLIEFVPRRRASCN